VESYQYDVFGSVTIFDGTGTVLPATAKANRFLYTGREWIQEVGLYDYRNRVYSPELGRFLQTDPIRFDAKDVNLYRYVKNSTTRFIDPTGKIAWAPIVAGAAAVIQALVQQFSDEMNNVCKEMKCKESCEACCSGVLGAGTAAVAASGAGLVFGCAAMLAIPPPFGPIAFAACSAAVLAISVDGNSDIQNAYASCSTACQSKPSSSIPN
jgi:RHS repeat-associated protein